MGRHNLSIVKGVERNSSPGREGLLRYLLQFSCQIRELRLVSALALAWLPLLAACGTEPSSPPEAAPDWPGAASADLAEELAGASGAVEQLAVRARTAAERLRFSADINEIEPARTELDLCMGAMALLPQAADLPWQAWLEESRFTLPELAAAQMRAAGVALGIEAIPVARFMDFRESPSAARIQAHEIFWLHDEGEALVRANKLLMSERPRNRDELRPRFVEEVLLPKTQDSVTELMLDIATSDRMEGRARILAVRALSDRGSPEAPAILESLFDTEGRNFLLRKEALLAILQLEPERAHRMLLEDLPSRDIDLGMWEFMRDLREQEGLPVPGS